jgi:hypothetical protein
VAVEDAEAPGGEHQQAGAGKQNAHERMVSARVSPLKPPTMSVTKGAASTPESTSTAERAPEWPHGAGHASGFLFVAFRQQLRVDRNERCREDAFAEEILQQIGNAEGAR